MTPSWPRLNPYFVNPILFISVSLNTCAFQQPNLSPRDSWGASPSTVQRIPYNKTRLFEGLSRDSAYYKLIKTLRERNASLSLYLTFWPMDFLTAPDGI